MAESMNNIGAAFDSRSLDALKRVAKSDRQAGPKGAAKQMEAVFVQMMLKSMRDATPKEGLFSSQQSEMFTSMLDQQLAQNIASQGTLGFAGMMLKSLGAEEAKQDPAPQALVQTAVAADIRLPAKRPLLTAPLYSLQRSAPIKGAEAVRPTTSTGPVLNNANFIASLSGPAIALLFLSFNGHLWLIAIVVQSFERLPIDDAPLLRDGFYALVEHAGIIFSYGLMLGLPVVTLLLAINLALGLLNRLTPQLSIFVIGFPLTLTVGMLSLSMLMRTLTPFLENLLRLLFDGLDEMLMMFI